MNNNKNRTALITGATGFVGSHLVRRLVRDEWDVHIIVRTSSNLDIIKDVADKISIHEHDGSTDAMIDIVKKARPVIVFHVASLFISDHEPGNLEPLIQSNILFGAQMLEALNINQVHKLINTGTSWQHYHNEDYNPVCLYAATKQAFEAILKFYIETTPLKAITLKLFDTYGPDDPRPKLLNLLKKGLEDQETLLMSPGEQLINIVYIDDVVDAFITAAERLTGDKCDKYEDYAVSSENPVKLKEFVKTCENIAGKELKIQWGGRPYRKREVMVPWNRGKLLPGWTVKTGLEEGIRKTWSLHSA